MQVVSAGMVARAGAELADEHTLLSAHLYAFASINICTRSLRCILVDEIIGVIAV
jgi:hypothetical protein